MVIHLPERGCNVFGAVEFRAFGQIHLPEYSPYFDA
jgi:hypothetical protein